ncbi:MAG: endonuclease MutS2 [Bacteroidetes bacterium]|nr:endonuclease MutS2 [Bacteroidota bacterium]
MDGFYRAAEKLDLPKILHRISYYASSELGKEAAENLEPCSTLQEISVEMKRIDEMKRLLEGENNIPIQGIKDIRSSLQRAGIAESTLSAAELLSIAQTINTSQKIKKYIERRSDYLPELFSLTSVISIHKELEFNVFQAIDEEGRVKDSASKELKSIRSAIINKKLQIQRSLERILRAVSDQGMVRDEILTTRDGRMVIPIKSELKNKFPGFIHSASATGQTVYIEPSETLTLNNEVTELHYKEQREVERILKELTLQVYNVVNQLQFVVDILTKLDLSYAKAKYSIEIQGNTPFIKEEGSLVIQNGYHPILLMRHKRNMVVPLSIRIGESFNTILISGPNAGGKSVTLKTVGLLSLLVRYGIHVPASPDSEFPLFPKIFVLIGDNQSIENDLSTFSSQILQLKEILEEAAQNCLVLIDEIGSNTDPAEGGAMAASALEYLSKINAITLATTHQTALKAFVHNSVLMENGAMEFNQNTLLPTYRFKVGQPGSSYAFEIASRLGIKREILLRAKDFLGTQQNKLEKLLFELENRTQLLENKIKESDAELLKNKELSSIYEQKNKLLNNEIKELKRRAVEEAKELIEKASSQIELTVKEIKLQQANKEVIKTSKNKITQIENELKSLEQSLADDKTVLIKNLKKKIKINDIIKLKASGQTGVVLSLPDKEGNLSIGFNSIKAKISLENIELLEKKNSNKTAVSSFVPTDKEFSSEVDVRGFYGDDAITIVDKFLDDALISGLQRVDIIHGKGTGALRKKISLFLESDKRVKLFRLGEWNEGGAGVTVVELS